MLIFGPFWLVRGQDMSTIMTPTPSPRKQPTDWLGLEVDADCAGQGVGNHQRRGGQVVGSGQWMDAALEVPIPRQHAACYQVTLQGIINNF